MPRLSRLAGQVQVGERREQRGQRLDQLHPRQRSAQAEVHPGAEGEVRVRVAGRVEDVGVGEHRRVAVGGAEQRRDLLALLDDHSPDLHVARSPCARRAGAPSRSAASPRPSAPGPLPVAGRATSSATRPLPNTFTDASWPALSRSTTAATSSSSLSPAASRSVVRSSAGSVRRRSRCSRTRSANSRGRGHGGVDHLRRRRRLVHPHDRLRPAPQRRARRRRRARPARR